MYNGNLFIAACDLNFVIKLERFQVNKFVSLFVTNYLSSMSNK